MSSLARNKLSTDSNHPCPDLATLAERELSAFFSAITQLFGPQQAELCAEDWLQELIEIDGLPGSTRELSRELRMITAKASTRLASRVRRNASSLSSSSSLFTTTQIA